MGIASAGSGDQHLYENVQPETLDVQGGVVVRGDVELWNEMGSISQVTSKPKDVILPVMKFRKKGNSTRKILSAGKKMNITVEFDDETSK